MYPTAIRINILKECHNWMAKGSCTDCQWNGNEELSQYWESYRTTVLSNLLCLFRCLLCIKECLFVRLLYDFPIANHNRKIVKISWMFITSYQETKSHETMDHDAYLFTIGNVIISYIYFDLVAVTRNSCVLGSLCDHASDGSADQMDGCYQNTEIN